VLFYPSVVLFFPAFSGINVLFLPELGVIFTKMWYFFRPLCGIFTGYGVGNSNVGIFPNKCVKYSCFLSHNVLYLYLMAGNCP